MVSNDDVGKAAVFLDRDGVINRSLVFNGKPYAPRTISEVEILEGVPEALSNFRQWGYICVVVTNQPDLETGKQSPDELDRIHRWMEETLKLDGIFVCPHHSASNCDCRKPKVGLFEEAKLQFNIEYSKSILVGDRWSDVEAGQTLGMHTNFFIDYGYLEKKPTGSFTTVLSLYEVSKIISKRLGSYGRQ